MNLGLGDRVIIVPFLLITLLIFAINYSKAKLSLESRSFDYGFKSSFIGLQPLPSTVVHLDYSFLGYLGNITN